MTWGSLLLNICRFNKRAIGRPPSKLQNKKYNQGLVWGKMRAHRAAIDYNNYYNYHTDCFCVGAARLRVLRLAGVEHKIDEIESHQWRQTLWGAFSTQSFQKIHYCLQKKKRKKEKKQDIFVYRDTQCRVTKGPGCELSGMEYCVDRRKEWLALKECLHPKPQGHPHLWWNKDY